MENKKEEYREVERWSIITLNRDGIQIVVNFGDRLCDYKGRCGFALSYDDLGDRVEFTCDPGEGRTLRMQNFEITCNWDRDEWEAM